MKQNVHKDVYQFAYDEAASELRRILQSFEQLCVQKSQVEKLLEVLKPELGVSARADANARGQRTGPFPHCTVITRLTVL
jgi:hypothetical protein